MDCRHLELNEALPSEAVASTPTAQYRLRPATQADTASLVGMVHELYRIDGVHDIPADHIGRTLARAATHPGEVMVAMVEGEGACGWLPAGYCIVATMWSNEFGGHVAILDELFVEGAHRGTGLGALVMSAVERACVRGGITTIGLEVEPANAPARGLYERRGYEQSPRLYLRKDLASPLR
jgi:GNAT superfamily N-acetyltransferase